VVIGGPIMAIEVVKAFGLEHVRRLTPLEEHALRAVKRAASGQVAGGAQKHARRNGLTLPTHR